MYPISSEVSLADAATMNITSIIEQHLGVKYAIKYNIGVDLLYNALRVYYVIIPMIFLIAAAQFLGQLPGHLARVSRFVRFVIEFVVIVIPTLLITLKFHKHAGYVTIICSAILLAILLINLIMKPRGRPYITGSRRPHAFALNRAIVYVIAVLGLAAPRFFDIPTYFKETYSYGAGFLDVGVGLYIFAIATVKRTGVGRSPMDAAPRFFLPMVFLAYVRMLIILLNKDNDSNPISLHENYYFLFTMVVVIGSIICEHVRNSRTRIRIGLAILLGHEIILQTCTANYLLSTTVERIYFITALKEVYLSIPGFLALYLISVAIGDKLRTRVKPLPVQLFRKKIMTILKECVSYWTLTLLCAFTTSISRVCCNTGYVAWILAIGCTMTLMHMLVFSLIFNTVKHGTAKNSIQDVNVVPEFVRTINKNGVICYVLGYLLAISISQFLSSPNRDDFESFCILTIFMFIIALFSYLLNNVNLFDL